MPMFEARFRAQAQQTYSASPGRELAAGGGRPLL